MNLFNTLKRRITNKQLVLSLLGLMLLLQFILLFIIVGNDIENIWIYLTPSLIILFMVAIIIYHKIRKNIFGDENNTNRNETNEIQNIKDFFQNYLWSVEIFDRKGNLIWANKYGCQFWSTLSKDRDSDINIFNFEKLKDSDFIDYIEKSYKGENLILNGSDYHSKILNDDSLFKYYETSFSPVFSSSNKVVAVVIINREIINEGYNKKPNNYLSGNSEYNQSISFLHNISHELRTPLNWIIGFSDLIQKESDPLRIKKFNENINKGGKLMLSSIEMLLNMSLIVKNEVSIKRSEFSIVKSLNAIKNNLEEEIKTVKNNHIGVNVSVFLNDDCDDYLITSDENKFNQVINYLAHNALKFTNEGYIELGCRILPEKTILFFIKDTGIGISEDIQQYIFDIFKKGNDNTEKTLSGQGLGLSIAKHFVKLLGGNIWFNSESKKGSTFYFTIKDYSTGKELEPFFLHHKSETKKSSSNQRMNDNKKLSSNKVLHDDLSGKNNY